mgnify:FL=1
MARLLFLTICLSASHLMTTFAVHLGLGLLAYQKTSEINKLRMLAFAFFFYGFYFYFAEQAKWDAVCQH